MWLVRKILLLMICSLNLMANYKLTDEEIKHYESEGYLILKGLYADDIQLLSDTAEKAINQGRLLMPVDSEEEAIEFEKSEFFLKRLSKSSVAIKRIVWVGGTYTQFLDAGRNPKLLVPIFQLLQAQEVNHLICQLHPKMPKDGVKFDVHRDIDNRKFFDPDWKDIGANGSFVQTLIAIDEMDETNGTLIVFPGSHTKDEPLKGFPERQKEYLQKSEEESVHLYLNPGDVVFFHPNIVHYSESNNSDKSRRVLINGFSTKGANHVQYPGIGSGELLSAENYFQ